MLVTQSIKLDVLGLVAAIVVILISWHIWVLGYWRRKGVLTPKTLFLFGSMKDFFFARKSIGEYYRDLYIEYKAKGNRYIGIFFSGKPYFVPIDIDIVKSILQTDFQHFHSHGTYCNEAADPLSINIFNLDGSKWKVIRSKLTPTFTPGKIKVMHQALLVCSEVLKTLLEEYPDNKPVDIKDVMGRFTTDIIGSCAFGLEINSLKNPDTQFRKLGNEIFALDFASTLRFICPSFIPHEILKFFGYQNQKPHLTEYFYNLVLSTLKNREENNIYRNDFLDLLLKMKNSNDEEEKLSVNEIAAQSFFFYLAGFETSSTAMNFACYELAINQDIQTKLREEIETVLKKYNNEITYEAVIEMEYLDRVIQESLRKYPPLPLIPRQCTKNYTIPGESIEIDSGVYTFIPVLGIHHDSEYYSNPEKFDPERFNEENKKTRPAFTYLPFGGGPRICLGLRFGMHQTKIGLITLLNNFKISLNEKTKTPLVYNKTLVMSCEGGIWLDLKRI